MRKTSAAIMIAFALSLATFAEAKSYSFTLAAPATAGTTVLKAGEYEVKVTGTKAVLTNASSGKSVTIDVKVEQAAQKFNNTTVATKDKNGVSVVDEIDLDGSTTRLEFGQ